MTGGEWSRTIVIMRHARAVSFAESDQERALTPAGEADAAEAGAWLAGRLGAPPDHVLVSSALRTRQTWAAVASAAGWTGVDAEFEDGLYSAGPEAALEYLRAAPEGAEVVLYLGHNPTASYLIHLVEDGGADPALFERVSGGCPPASVAVLGTDRPWADLGEGGARLLDFHVGSA